MEKKKEAMSSCQVVSPTSCGRLFSTILSPECETPEYEKENWPADSFISPIKRKRKRPTGGAACSIGALSSEFGVLSTRTLWSNRASLESSNGLPWTPDAPQTKTAPRAPKKSTNVARQLVSNSTAPASDHNASRKTITPCAGVRSKAPMVDFPKLIAAMVKQGIRMLALDWDLTMVSCDTHSVWYGKANELAKFLRPCMISLVCAAAKSGIQIAIVSFSGQGKLIRNTLEIALPQIASTFVLRCSDKQWQVCDTSFREFFPGQSPTESPTKLKHLHSAVKQFKQMDMGSNNLPIVPQNMFLIDDNPMNIAAARDNGVNAILMETDNPDATMLALVREFLTE